MKLFIKRNLLFLFVIFNILLIISAKTVTSNRKIEQENAPNKLSNFINNIFGRNEIQANANTKTETNTSSTTPKINNGNITDDQINQIKDDLGIEDSQIEDIKSKIKDNLDVVKSIIDNIKEKDQKPPGEEDHLTTDIMNRITETIDDVKNRPSRLPTSRKTERKRTKH